MDTRLSIEVIAKTIESAFEPLECVVEVRDYRDKVGFRIYSPKDEPLLTVHEVPTRQLRSPRSLADIINVARQKIEAKGFKLASWTPPTGEA